MKKLVSVLLCLAMLAGVICLPVSAARGVAFEETLAQDLKELGLFRGVSETDFALDRAPTRTEALVMLIRVLGKEQEALNGSWTFPFTDVAPWAAGYVGYAYENGLTKGVSETAFGTGNANCAMYLTFVLRALGYDDAAGDFTWDKPYELAASLGLLGVSVDQNTFWRADVVLISYAALPVYLKNSTQTLYEKLIGAGVFTREAYDNVYDANAIKEHEQVKVLSSEELYAKCSPAVFYIEVCDKNGKAFASGSGFFLNSAGVAVTNYHVIEGSYSATITTSDTQQEYKVTGVWDYSVEQDWAVIQVEGEGFSHLNQADVSSLAGGAKVYAIGSPLGLQNTISEGIVSNVSREVEGVTYIQTTAAISQGSSGGALLNEFGHVIGITSASYTEGQNLNLALPISVVQNYSSAGLKTLASVAESQQPAQPTQPQQPATGEATTGTATRQQAYERLQNWILHNSNAMYANQYRSVKMGKDNWIFELYIDTELGCLTGNYVYRFPSGAEMSGYLDLYDQGTTAPVMLYYYFEGDTGWSMRAYGEPDASYFPNASEMLPLHDYKGDEEYRAEMEELSYIAASRIITLLELIFREYLSENGTYGMKCFGFQSYNF